MTNPVPDFDAEKRRRRYAAVMGSVGAAVFIASGMLTLWIAGLGTFPEGESIWVVLIVLFGFWFFFFLLKFAAAYAFWFRPYATRKRAISLSVLAFFIVYFLMSGAMALPSIFATPIKGPKVFFEMLWEWHKFTYGIPYVAAALIGWRFARPAPDVRESF